MFGVLLASYAINAMDRQLFPLLVPDVRREYGFSLSGAGFLSTVFTLGMAVAVTPTGYLLARFPRNTVLPLGLPLFSAAPAPTVLPPRFPALLLSPAPALEPLPVPLASPATRGANARAVPRGPSHASDVDLYVRQGPTIVSNGGINSVGGTNPSAYGPVTSQTLHAALPTGQYEFLVVAWSVAQDTYTLDGNFTA